MDPSEDAIIDDVIAEEAEQETAQDQAIRFTRWEPRGDLTKAKILLYGAPKIGKSTLASHFPGALFFELEPGLDWLSSHSIIITDWNTTEMHMEDHEGRPKVVSSFLHAMKWLKEERPRVLPGTTSPLRTIICDPIDIAYKMCTDAVCDALGISSPSDLEWGRGWNAVSAEWSKYVCMLTTFGYGTVFTSHMKETKRKSQAREIDMLVPSIQNAGAKVVTALVDIILYAYMSERAEIDDEGQLTGNITEQRVLRCQPQNNVIAGDRTGFLPMEIPLDYAALLKYFPATPKD